MTTCKSLLISGTAGVMLLLNACTTVPPYPVQANSPPLTSVRHDLAAHRDQIVTWGGVILGIDVKQNNSLVTVLAKPLDKNGEPVASGKSDGRFLARFTGFRDPAVFSTGRNLTITGVISSSETHKIGEYPYVYPVVVVTHYRLWPTPYYKDRRQQDEYWWYNPWYPGYPGYPWYGYDYDYHIYQPAPSTFLPAPQKRR